VGDQILSINSRRPFLPTSSFLHNFIVSAGIFDIMTSKVWVKLRGSRADAFKVEVDEDADFDDLKNAISAKKKVEVEFIYSAEHSEEHGEDSKCKASSAFISSYGQEAGSSEENPYYYTIAPPATRGKVLIPNDV
jgi:hypothetical protein